MSAKGKKDNLPVPVESPENSLIVSPTKAIPLTRENLVTLLQDGLTTVQEAGEFLDLNPEQIRFAELFANECAGDAFAAVCEVHGLNPQTRSEKEKANRTAKNYTRHRDILLLINAMLTLSGFNDQAADRNLTFLMHQKADLKVSLAATKIYTEQTKRLDREEAESRKRKLDWSKVSTKKLEYVLSVIAEADPNAESSLLTQFLPAVEFKDLT